jgi:S-adenosylmethionine uptake transporter
MPAGWHGRAVMTAPTARPAPPPTPTAAGLRPGGPGRPAVEQGMLLMALAMLIVPVIDALGKLLTDTLAPGQIAWGRFFFQTLFMLPWLLLAARPAVRPRFDLHAARGALMAGATLFFFWSVAYLPLADAIAIFFVEPLILTVFSAVFLGEAIGWRRLTAVIVGFGGALVVIQPGWAVFGPAALLPLAAAGCFAGYLTITRMIAERESAVSLQFWAGLAGLIVLTVALAIGELGGVGPIDPVWPSADDWVMLAGVGAVATLGHYLVVLAFARAPAGVLAPFQYLEIISATLLGLVIFGDFPRATTWLGVAIIIGAGLYVFHRERQVARTVSAALPPEV